MIDRKSLAAGDESESQGPVLSQLPDIPLSPIDPVERLCDRCGSMTLSLRSCSGCAALNRKVCGCGCLVNQHNFSRSHITNRRYWFCGHCFPSCEQISCDPVKQEKTMDIQRVSHATGMRGATWWIDKNENI